MLHAALLAMLQAASPPPAPPPAAASPALPTLRLICRGTGEREVQHQSFGSLFTNRGGSAFGGSSYGSQSQFGDGMDIDLADGAAKVRVPRRFLPPLHGGAEGWFAIKDLVVTDDTITGMVLINMANHPKMRIDRRTGTVNLDGKVGSYAGECQPYDPATTKRAF